MNDTISKITQYCDLVDLKKVWGSRILNVIEFTDLLLSTTPSSLNLS